MDARTMGLYLQLFLSVLSISCMHVAPGCSHGTMKLLAFATHQFAHKIMDLSVPYIRISFNSSY